MDRKGVLRLGEQYAVLGLIFEVFLDVPLKAHFAHGIRLTDWENRYHIKIWLYIWLRLLNLQPLTLNYTEKIPYKFILFR
jgi:hypothetical protein